MQKGIRSRAWTTRTECKTSSTFVLFVLQLTLIRIKSTKCFRAQHYCHYRCVVQIHSIRLFKIPIRIMVFGVCLSGHSKIKNMPFTSAKQCSEFVVIEILPFASRCWFTVLVRKPLINTFILIKCSKPICTMSSAHCASCSSWTSQFHGLLTNFDNPIPVGLHSAIKHLNLSSFNTEWKNSVIKTEFFLPMLFMQCWILSKSASELIALPQRWNVIIHKVGFIFCANFRMSRNETHQSENLFAKSLSHALSSHAMHLPVTTIIIWKPFLNLLFEYLINWRCQYAENGRKPYIHYYLLHSAMQCIVYIIYSMRMWERVSLSLTLARSLFLAANYVNGKAYTL